MTDERLLYDEPCYVISVAARMVQLHPQTLRYYDRLGLIRPSRTAGRIRLYSPRDIATLRKIVRITADLGVNLAGVEVILNMSTRIAGLQRQLDTAQQREREAIAALQQRIRMLEEQSGKRAQDHQIINVSATEVESNPKEGQE